MVRGTTPTVTLTIPGVSLKQMKSIYVTIQQYSIKLTKKNGDPSLVIGDSTIEVHLSQEETLSFKSGIAEIQVRCLTQGGKAFATNICTVEVKSILLEEVIA